MKVYLQSITGWDDAFTTLYMSKGTWTPELGDKIHASCDLMLNRSGIIQNKAVYDLTSEEKELFDFFDKNARNLFGYGKNHITMMRFLDFTFVVDGLHRAAQDDFDAHTYRLHNRIIRLSTRISVMKNLDDFGRDLAMSDYYKNKVITLSEAARILGFDFPLMIEKNGEKYVRSINGYVREDCQDPNTKRGLYPLGMASLFVFKCNLCEYPHIRDLRMRKTEGHPQSGHAHPELWDLIDMIDAELYKAIPYLNSEWLDYVKQ